MVHEYFQGS